MTKINLNQSPYFDDYLENKKYYRILFRPGRAVQARELNQIHSLIQKQLERFGNNIFDPGSQVLPGKNKESVRYINNNAFIKVDITATNNANSLLSTKTLFETYWKDQTVINDVATSQHPGIKAKVIGYRETDQKNEIRLYLDYTKTSEDGTKQTFSPGETIKLESQPTIVANIATHEYAVGKISSVTLEESVYYVNGNFIVVDAQRHFIIPNSDVLSDGTIIDPDGATSASQALWMKDPSAQVGLKITESVVTYEAEKDLLDNALGTPNYSAPGADRLRILAELTQIGPNDEVNVSDFIVLLTVLNGVVKLKPTFSDYNVLEDTLARRTYDESGDYTVIPFLAHVKPFLDDGKNNGAHNIDDFKCQTEEIAKKLSISKFNVPAPGTSHRFPDNVNGFYYPGVDQNDFKQLCDDRLIVKLDPGKAYVRGFEIEKLGTNDIPILKSRTLHFQNGATVQTPLGSFFYVKGLGGTPTVGKKINLYSQILERNAETSSLPLAPQSANLIGTARIAGVEYYSGTPGSVTDGVYRLFLFDISINQGSDLKDVKSFYSTSPTFGCNCVLNAFKLDGSVEVTSQGVIKGTGTSWRNDETQRVNAGDYVQVGTGSDAKLFRVLTNPATDTTLNVVGGSSGGINSAGILAQSPTVAPGATIYIMYTVMQTNSTDAGYLYKLPDNYIYTLRTGAQDRVDDTQIDTAFVTRKYFTGLTPTTIGTKKAVSASLIGKTERFESFSNNGYAVISSNGDWLEVRPYVTGTPSSGVAEIQISGTTITAYLNSSDAGAPGISYDLITSVYKGPGLTGMGTNNQGPASSMEAQKTLIKGYFDPDTKLYVGNGHITSTTGNIKELSLGKADVLRVTRIVAGDSPTGNENIREGVESIVTHLYTLDDGQRDCYYDIAKIVLIPGASAPSGKIRVEFDYFEHTGPGLYFSTDSYAFKGVNKELNYEDIPDYVAADGTVYHLASCIDFRPVVSDITYDASGNPTGGGLLSANPFKFPTTLEFPKDSFTCDYHRYRGRKDKLFLDKNKEFYVKQGKPDINPQAPDEPDTGMVLYDISLDPYTASTQAVRCNMRDNRRYTMKDIGKLENRIKNLEYYTSLSMLEASTKSLEIKDAAGRDKFKNGFLVDNFSSYTGSDISSRDWKASLDLTDKVCRPLSKTDAVKLIDSDISRTNADRLLKHHQKTGDVYTLPYTHTLMTSQKKASKVISVNPYSVFTYVGKVNLYPWTDEWRDVNNLEPLTVRDESQYQAQVAYYGPKGTHVDYRQTLNNWTGVHKSEEYLGKSLVVGGHAHLDKLNKKERQFARDTKTMIVPPGYPNAGQRIPATGGRGYVAKTWKQTTTVTGDAITTTFTSTLKDDGWSAPIDLGTRVIDTASAEFIRSRFVLFKAQCFKPTTKLYAFFDGKQVTSECGPLTKAQYDAALPLIDNMINPVIALLPFPWEIIKNQDLITDSTGTIYGVFRIPNNPQGTRFRTGDRLFRLTTSFNNSQNPVPESAGEVNYTARGWIENRQSTTLSTRLFHIERGATTSSTPISKELSSSLVMGPPCPSDPIAQSFFVHEATGCYVTKVNVYFFKRPSVSRQPNGEPEVSGGIEPDIELQLRPLDEGGNPSTIIMPFGRVILKANEVTTNHVNPVTKKLTITQPNSTDPSLAPTVTVLDTITSDKFVPTTFEFESPIYLSPKTSYCVVLESQATVDYKVWIAQYGPDITTRDGVDSFVPEGTFNNEIGTSNPIANPCYIDGMFFKSENSISWVADPSVDMMFEVHKAKFDISTTGEIDFVNTELPLVNVTLDAITTKSGSSKIRVLHPGHGHYVGSPIRFIPNLDQKIKISPSGTLSTATVQLAESVPSNLVANVFVMNPTSRQVRKVTSVDTVNKTITLNSNFDSLTGVTELLYCKESYTPGTLNGIIPEKFFHEDGFIVDRTEMDYYVVDLGSTSIDLATSASGRTGGENIFVTDNVRFEQMQLLTTPLITPETKIEWNVETTSSAGITDSRSIPEVILPRVNIEPNNLLYFSNPMQIMSYKGEQKLGNKKTLSVRAVLSSTSENLSPVIDKSRMTVELTHNRLDNPYGKIEAGIDAKQVINDVYDIYSCIPNESEGLPAGVPGNIYGNITNKIYFTNSNAAKSGTISVALDSRNVTGSTTPVATQFLTELRTGDKLRLADGGERTITEIKSNTELVIDTPFQSTVTNQAYYSNVSYMRIKTADDKCALQLSKLDVGKYVTIKIVDATSSSGGLVNTTRAIDQNQHESGTTGGSLVLAVNYTPTNTVVDPDLGAPKKAEVEIQYKCTEPAGMETNAVFINQKDRFIDEIAPAGGSCSAKYVSKKLTVTRPSNSLKIMFDGSRHESCEFELYYKLEPVNSTKDIDDINWVRGEFNLDVEGVLTPMTPEPNDSTLKFSAYECTLNNLPSFVGAQVKVVMRGGNPARTPKLMNFRMIILDE